MHNDQINFSLVDDLPAVLDGGKRVVAVPEGTTIEMDASRKGVRPTLVPGPERGDDCWPLGPQFSDASITAAVDLLETHRGGGEPHPPGDRGPYERDLVGRLVARFGRDDGGREPKVYLVPDGSKAPAIACRAIMIQRHVNWGLPALLTPTMVTSIGSPGAIWGAARPAGLKPVFVDTERATGVCDPKAIADVADDSTALAVIPALNDAIPDMDALHTLCRRRRIGSVLDLSHGPLATWNSLPAPKYVDITTISADRTSTLTTGSEGGLIVVYDDVLARIVAKLCENAPLGELGAIMLGGSLDMYDELELARARTLRNLRDGLERSRGPWRMLEAQRLAGGMTRGVTLLFDPTTAEHPEAWTRMGPVGAAWVLAEEMLTEVDAGYPLPWDPASGYHTESDPWMQGVLLAPDVDPAAFPNAAYFADRAHVLPHRFLERPHGKVHLLTAIEKLVRAIGSGVLDDWIAQFGG